MNPNSLAGLVLLALTLGFALLGVVLVRLHHLRRRKAGSFSRVCAALVLVGAWALTRFVWPELYVRPVDFWSVMAILGIVAYALIWAALAWQFNRQSHDEFGEGFMLSMLYRDSEHIPTRDAGQKKSGGRSAG